MTVEPTEQRLGQKPEFLSRLKVDGKYAPSPMELVELFKKINLVEEFKETRLLQQSDGEMSLSFDTLEHSHLFAFLLIAKAIEEKLTSVGLSEEDFDGDSLHGYRIDGNQLAYTEKKVDGGIVGNLQVVSHSLDQYRVGQFFKIVQIIKPAIEQAMPHLKGVVKDYLSPELAK